MRQILKVTWLRGLVLLATSNIVTCGGAPPAEEAGPSAETAEVETHPTRLYVLDCGHVSFTDLAAFSLSLDEVSAPEIAVPCFLVEHERGTLIWDLGLPEALGPEGTTVDGITMLVATPLTTQLAELGYSPGDIDYFAMSHMHLDHSGNANLFQDVTWLAREVERDHAFGNEVEGGFGWDPTLYEGLRDVEPVLIEGNYDVFGDGTVVIRSAPGHTPGHQVLFVDLAESGPIVLSGDLYHFAESRKLRRVPVFNTDEAQTLASMDAVDVFLQETGSELWIQHDFPHNQTLRKSPEFYQ